MDSSSSTLIWVAVIAAIPTTITALAAAIVSIINLRQSRRNRDSLAEAKKTIDKVETDVNGMKDDLVKAKTEAARAEGIIEGALTIEAKKVPEEK